MKRYPSFFLAIFILVLWGNTSALALTLIIIDVPGAISTLASGINDRGQVVGSFTDSNRVGHGFLRNEDGTFTTIDPPDSIGTHPVAINKSGQILGFFCNHADSGTALPPGVVCGSSFTTASAVHGFLRDKDGTFTAFDAPGSIGTVPSSINDKGQIVGSFVPSFFVARGFLAVP